MSTDKHTPEQDTHDAATDPLDAAQEPQEDERDDQQEDTPDDAGKAGKEAAKYRTRLRATEAERDGMSARLETAHKHIVETVAAAHLERPAALWAAGTDLPELLDEDGNVDAAKVQAACKTATDTLGLAPHRPGPYAPNEGNATRPPQPRDDMASVIAGNN